MGDPLPGPALRCMPTEGGAQGGPCWCDWVTSAEVKGRGGLHAMASQTLRTLGGRFALLLVGAAAGHAAYPDVVPGESPEMVWKAPTVGVPTTHLVGVGLCEARRARPL